MQRLLAGHLLPQLAGGSQDFARQILTYVETTNVASLGVFGVIWLLVALMILMTNVEQAFNHIWTNFPGPSLVAQTQRLFKHLSLVSHFAGGGHLSYHHLSKPSANSINLLDISCRRRFFQPTIC